MLISEKFVSYQSEGKYAGTPAIFIRVAGCNCKCSYCDEDNKIHQKVTIQELENYIKYHYFQSNIRLVVITGGEPTLQYEEVQEFINNIYTTYVNIIIQVESNGVNKKIFRNCEMHISPKEKVVETVRYYKNKPNVFFKFIVEDKNSLKLIQKAITNYDETYYLQPEYSKQEEVTKMIMQNYSLLKNFRFSFQTHKWLDVK